MDRASLVREQLQAAGIRHDAAAGVNTASFDPISIQDKIRAAASGELIQKHVVLHELFENQRASSVLSSTGTSTWSSAYPGLLSTDPLPFTNRVHQRKSGYHAHDPMAEGVATPTQGPPAQVEPPAGWEFEGGWFLLIGRSGGLQAKEAKHVGEADGWTYADDFAALRQQLLEPKLTEAPSRKSDGSNAEPSGVRWRRWARLRTLTAAPPGRALHTSRRGAGSAAVVGGYDDCVVPESAVLCEGWLSRVQHARWVQHWAILLRGRDGSTAHLLFCDSAEGLAVVEGLSSPPARFDAADEILATPAVADLLRRTLDAAAARSCFALGSEAASAGGDGGRGGSRISSSSGSTSGTAKGGRMLLRACSEADKHRWRRAFAEALAELQPMASPSADDVLSPATAEDVEASAAADAGAAAAGGGAAGVATSDEALPRSADAVVGGGSRASQVSSGAPAAAVPPGTLTVHVMGANGLAAGDKNGYSDPYAKLTVKAGQQTYFKETEVAKRTVDPIWRKGPWTFRDVASDATELVLVVKDRDYGIGNRNDYLGQVRFSLRALAEEGVVLPEDGSPIELSGPRWTRLGPVTEGSRKSKLDKIEPKGEVRLKVGWRQMTEEEQAAVAEKGASRSSELEGYESADDPSDLESSAEEEEDDDEDGQGRGGGGAQAAAAAAAARKEREQAAIEHPPKRGDYQLHVHVLEARDLVGRDLSGVSDPAVFVTCFGETRRTAAKEQQASPVWNEHLFLLGSDLDETKLNASQIEVAVYDSISSEGWPKTCCRCVLVALDLAAAGCVGWSDSRVAALRNIEGPCATGRSARTERRPRCSQTHPVASPPPRTQVRHGHPHPRRPGRPVLVRRASRLLLATPPAAPAVGGALGATRRAREAHRRGRQGRDPGVPAAVSDAARPRRQAAAAAAARCRCRRRRRRARRWRWRRCCGWERHLDASDAQA